MSELLNSGHSIGSIYASAASLCLLAFPGAMAVAADVSELSE